MTRRREREHAATVTSRNPHELLAVSRDNRSGGGVSRAGHSGGLYGLDVHAARWPGLHSPQDLFQTCEECQADVAPFFAGSEAFYQWASLVTDDPGRLLSRLWAERERIMQSIAEPPLGAEGVGE